MELNRNWGIKFDVSLNDFNLKRQSFRNVDYTKILSMEHNTLIFKKKDEENN